MDDSLYSDKVFKYKGLEWELFGRLKHVRSQHESILFNGQGEVSKFKRLRSQNLSTEASYRY